MGGMKDLFGDTPFEEARARRTDPETSHEAAESLNVATLLGRVYHCLKTNGVPMTQWEVTWALNETKQNISPRFRQLEEKMLIKRVGKRKAKNDQGGMTNQETWTVSS